MMVSKPCLFAHLKSCHSTQSSRQTQRNFAILQFCQHNFVFHWQLLYKSCNSFWFIPTPHVKLLDILLIFRQHAASIYGFFCQSVPLVSVSKKNSKCNISWTENQIFMKFETYVYKIVLAHQPNFHKDPCKDARARGVNARTHVKKNLCVRSLG